MNRGVLSSSHPLPWPPSRDPCSVSSGPDRPRGGGRDCPRLPPRPGRDGRHRGRGTGAPGPGRAGTHGGPGDPLPPEGEMRLPQDRCNASERKAEVPCRGSRRGGEGQTDKQLDRYRWGEDAPTAAFCLGVSDPHCLSTRRREEINCNQLIINPI